MESKKLQRPRWLDSFIGPKNSHSNWLQQNLEDMNWNFRRMLKIIEDSNAESFVKKVEMYYACRQELVNLVEKCYRLHCLLAERHNHATGVSLINIPKLDSQGRDFILSNVSSKIQSPLPLSKFPSSKKINAPVGSVSKELKRSVSVKRPARTLYSFVHCSEERCYVELCESESSKEPGYLRCYSESQSEDDDDDEEEEELQHDELEAELRDMIEKLYIDMEWDRVVSKSQGGILRYEDNTHDDEDEKFISSNVDKALLEENLELQGEICRLLKEISYLEEYNQETNERCESSTDKAHSQAIQEAETLFASEVEQLKGSIVKKNNDIEELNKILEAVVAERDQLKARVAMLDADPNVEVGGPSLVEFWWSLVAKLCGN